LEEDETTKARQPAMNAAETTILAAAPDEIADIGHDNIGDAAVDKLHRKGVFEEVAPGGIHGQKPLGYDGAIHEGPGIVAHAGVEAGDEGPCPDLQNQEHTQDGSGRNVPWIDAAEDAAGLYAACHVDERDEEQRGGAEMSGKSILRHRGQFGKT